MESWQLIQRQGLPLEAKITHTKNVIRQWYDYWEGNVYVAFSGGKDSTVLLHIVREVYPDVPAIFSNTGLEYPEVVQFVKKTENVIWTKSKTKKYMDKYKERNHQYYLNKINKGYLTRQRTYNKKRKEENI